MKKIILIICGIFLMGCNTFAQEQSSGVISGQIAVIKKSTITVKESTKQIESQNIEILDYGRIKIKKEKKTKTGEKTIEFYDEKGKLIKQLKLDRWDKPRISQNKKLIGIQKYGFKSQELKIFNENGEKIKSHKNIVPYRNIYVSDDTSFIVGGSKNTQHKFMHGGIAFYNAKGFLIKKIYLENLANHIGGYFGNNSYFIFLREIRGKGAIVNCYDKNGKILWKYFFKNTKPFNPYKAFSIEGENVFVKLFLNGKKYTWTFDKDGLVEKKKGW